MRSPSVYCIFFTPNSFAILIVFERRYRWSFSTLSETMGLFISVSVINIPRSESFRKASFTRWSVVVVTFITHPLYSFYTSSLAFAKVSKNTPRGS